MLALAVAIALLALSRGHHWVSDWTLAARHRLAEPTLTQLGRLSGPARMYILAPADAKTRRREARLMAHLRQRKADLTVTVLEASPELAKAARADSADAAGPPSAAQLALDGQRRVRIEHGERVEFARGLSTHALTTALYRLARAEERWIAGVVGHGERRFAGRTAADWTQFARRLARQGLRARDLPLAEVGAIPDNASALVVAAPDSAWLLGEVETLERYLQAGGNLLWVIDPASAASAEQARTYLRAHLGVEALDGTLVGRHTGQLARLSPTVTLVASYPDHPIVDGFERLTLYPGASAFSYEPTVAKALGGWQVRPIIRSSRNGWLETGALGGKVAFDDGTDRAGPLALGLALERIAPVAAGGTDGPKRTQRVILLADADFLCDEYLAHQGNAALGLRIVEWLTADDDVPPGLEQLTPPDQVLNLRGESLQLLAFTALLGLPGLLALGGVAAWWLRRDR